MENILITGGNGFLGSYLSTTLVEMGHSLSILDRSVNSNLSSKISFYNGSFDDELLLKKIFKEQSITCVVHLACTVVPGTETGVFLDSLNLNLTASLKLFHLCIDNKINKTIYLSSGGAIYGNISSTPISEQQLPHPLSPYGWLKLSIEKYLQLLYQQRGLNYLIVRPSNAYGIGQTQKRGQGIVFALLENLRHNRTTSIWGDGSVVRDYIHVKDIVTALSALLHKDQWNQIYNIGTGRGISLIQLISMIESITGTSLVIDYQPSRDVDVNTNFLDISKIKKNIGWTPKISLEDGIKEMWAQLQ